MENFEKIKITDDNTEGVVFAPYILSENVPLSITRKLNELNDSQLYTMYSDLMREVYYREHKYCPECGSKNMSMTCVGFPSKTNGKTLSDKISNYTFSDQNKAKCQDCGWEGIVDSLTRVPVDKLKKMRTEGSRLYLYLQNEWKHNGTCWKNYGKFFNDWFNNLTDAQILQFNVWTRGKCGPFYEF